MLGNNKEIPILKNNDQRKVFIENYKEWPVWFEVKEASETYYRLDLQDGSSLVICEYKYFADWMARYTGEDPHRAGTREYILVPGYKYLHDCLSNKTAMVVHLKELQKIKHE